MQRVPVFLRIYVRVSRLTNDICTTILDTYQWLKDEFFLLKHLNCKMSALKPRQNILGKQNSKLTSKLMLHVCYTHGFTIL